MNTRSKTGVFQPKCFTVSSPPLPQEPVSVPAALLDSHWKQGMVEEHTALLKNNTWTLVPFSEGMHVVDNKWIFRLKYNPDGSIQRYKARLVAKGFQQTAGIDFNETFSPVIKPCTIRVILTLAASYNWDIQQIDINNAFLNGDLQEVVFMSQPEGFVDSQFPHHVCRLNKALYGLKQAPRAWFDKLKTALVHWGFKNSKSDSSLFIYKNQSHVLFLLVYVDDILITGSDPTLIHRIMADLNKKFALKTLGSISYFLGFEAYRDQNGIFLSQTKYTTDLLKKANMYQAKPCSTSMCTGKKLFKEDSALFDQPTIYRSIIGGLQYLTMTRPDISFSVNKLSQFLQNPTVNHWNACKRVLRYLKGTTNFGLLFKPVQRMTLTGFSDADYANCLDDRRSVTGYVVYLSDNLIAWSARKQKVVARSNAESEYHSLALAATEILWLQSLFDELGVPQLTAVPVIWCDNMGANLLASNPVFHARTKHIEVDIHFIREKIEAKQLEVRFVPTEEQVADVLTKPLSTNRFEFL